MTTLETITTELKDGNPNGLREVYLSGKLCKTLVIPRGEVNNAKKHITLGNASLYFLVKEDDKTVYVGKSEGFYKRLQSHETEEVKEWDIAIQFSCSKLFATEAGYLEHLSITKMKETEQKKIINKNTPSQPNIDKIRLPAVKKFFEEVKTITKFLGYNFFEKTENIENKIKKDEIFYVRRRDGTGEAKLVYWDGKYRLLKGSKIKKEISIPKGKGAIYSHQERIQDDRNQLAREHSYEAKDDLITLSQDVEYNSPSRASNICIGNQSNGWVEWKNDDGKTLDEIYRKPQKV